MSSATRSSDGNEKVFRNFTSEKRHVCFYVSLVFLFLVAAAAAARPRPRPNQAMEMKKFSGI